MSNDKSNSPDVKNFEELNTYINSNYMINEDEHNALLHILSTHKYLEDRSIHINMNDFAPYSVNKKEKVKMEKLAEEIANKIQCHNESNGKLIKSKFDEKMKYKNTLYCNKSESYSLGGNLYFRDNADDIWEIPATESAWQRIEKSRLAENRYSDYYTKIAKTLSVYKNNLTTKKSLLFQSYIDGLITDDDFYIANIKVFKENTSEYILHSVQCKDGIIYKQDLKYNYTIEVPQEIIVSWRRIAKYD